MEKWGKHLHNHNLKCRNLSESFELETLLQSAEIKNSVRNKLDGTDRNFHDWYRFVLSFPPHLVRQYLNEFKLGENDIVLDPFCGTGTTLIEAKLQNIVSIGIEANPFAHFATTVKTNWDIDTNRLFEIAKAIREKVLERLARQRLTDDSSEYHLQGINFRRLTSEQEKLILKDSISPLPLHKALILLEEINHYKETEYFSHMRLAFANAAVYGFSNLKFGPEVGIGKIKFDSPVLSIWYNQIIKMIFDIEEIQSNNAYAKSSAILSDSRNIKETLNGYKISAVITSPPYPNEKDYTRTTRLESVLLDFIRDKEDLRRFKKTLLRSNTRGVYKEDTDDEYVKSFPEIQRIAEDIESRRIELGKTSGFERLYHKVTKLYFGGMAKHLLELQSVLKPNAHLAYVVGDQASYLRVMIRTGNLIAEIARSLGYEVVRIDLFRTRFSTITKTNLNEEVVVLRWPG